MKPNEPRQTIINMKGKRFLFSQVSPRDSLVVKIFKLRARQRRTKGKDIRWE